MFIYLLKFLTLTTLRKNIENNTKRNPDTNNIPLETMSWYMCLQA